MRGPSRTLFRARALPRTMTLPERHLWALLRRHALGLRFRRQHPAGAFVLDFYCPSAQLCVEVDGPAHDDGAHKSRDLARDCSLAEQGIRTLRFSAEAIMRPEQQQPILDAIIEAARFAPSTAIRRSPSPALRAGEDPTAGGGV